jgi:8-oxo-dGTP diphosphatase
MKITLVSVVIPLRKQGVNWQAWVQKRQEVGPLDGFFEFPGGKIEAGEDSAQAGARELLEEVSVDIKAQDLHLFQIFPFSYPDRKVCLYFHLLPVESEDAGWAKGLWCDLSEISSNLLAANIPVVEKLREYLEKEPFLGEWRE